MTHMKIGMTNIVHVHHPKAAATIIKNSKQIEKASIYKFGEPWVGTGLVTSKGAKWKQRRRLITPSFHFNILDKYMEAMNKHSSELVDILKRKCAAEEEIHLEMLLSMCTLDIICDTAMGVTTQAQNDTNSEYVRAIDKSVSLYFVKISFEGNLRF